MRVLRDRRDGAGEQQQVGIVAVARERGVAVAARRVEPACGEPCVGALVKRDQMVGIESERFVERGGGLVVPLRGEMRLASLDDVGELPLVAGRRGAHRPVLPKPPSARPEASNASTMRNAARATGTTTSCASRSSGLST